MVPNHALRGALRVGLPCCDRQRDADGFSTADFMTCSSCVLCKSTSQPWGEEDDSGCNILRSWMIRSATGEGRNYSASWFFEAEENIGIDGKCLGLLHVDVSGCHNNSAKLLLGVQHARTLFSRLIESEIGEQISLFIMPRWEQQTEYGSCPGLIKAMTTGHVGGVILF